MKVYQLSRRKLEDRPNRHPDSRLGGRSSGGEQAPYKGWRGCSTHLGRTRRRFCLYLNNAALGADVVKEEAAPEPKIAGPWLSGRAELSKSSSQGFESSRPRLRTIKMEKRIYPPTLMVRKPVPEIKAGVPPLEL